MALAPLTPKKGYACQLKVAGVAAGRARDVKLTGDGKEIDVSSRAGAGWKEFLQGLKEWAISVDQVWVADDTQLLALLTAWLNGTTVALRMVDGAYDTTTEWAATTVKALHDLVNKTGVVNTFTYEATSIGEAPHKTGGGEPAWPTVIGATVADGDITWTCRDKSRGFAGTAIVTKIERGEPLEGGLLLLVEIKGTGTLAQV